MQRQRRESSSSDFGYPDQSSKLPRHMDLKQKPQVMRESTFSDDDEEDEEQHHKGALFSPSEGTSEEDLTQLASLHRRATTASRASEELVPDYDPHTGEEVATLREELSVCRAEAAQREGKLRNEVEELKSMLEQAMKAKQAAEAEVEELRQKQSTSGSQDYALRREVKAAIDEERQRHQDALLVLESSMEAAELANSARLEEQRKQTLRLEQQLECQQRQWRAEMQQLWSALKGGARLTSEDSQAASEASTALRRGLYASVVQRGESGSKQNGQSANRAGTANPATTAVLQQLYTRVSERP